MKDFSIFEQALQFSDSDTENLGVVPNISRKQFDREDFRFRGTLPCLEYGSLMIENELLLRTNRSGRVYAGFGNLSCLQPIISRYFRIADLSEAVIVFGAPDWIPPPHPRIRFIYLEPSFVLVREWFVIADSPTFHVALIALDEDGSSAEPPDGRTFSVIKTSNPTSVSRLARQVDKLSDELQFVAALRSFNASVHTTN